MLEASIGKSVVAFPTPEPFPGHTWQQLANLPTFVRVSSIIYFYSCYHRGMDWSNEKTLFFIELYEKNPVLWDPKHPDHRRRSKLHDAWLRIQIDLDPSISITKLKKRKESLMSSYRFLRRKVEESRGTGSVFKPSWYAFEAIDRFLWTRGERGPWSNSELQDSWNREEERDDEETPNPGDMQDGESFSASPENTQSDSYVYTKPRDTKLYNINIPPKRLRVLPPHLDNGVVNCLEEPSDTLSSSRYRQPQRTDQCSIFGQLLAEQLRQLSPRNRILTQAKLNSVMEKAMLEELEDPP